MLISKKPKILFLRRLYHILRQKLLISYEMLRAFLDEQTAA